MTAIRLLWPPKELSPNARVHHMARANKARMYRRYAWAVAREAKLVAPEGKIELRLHFAPPDRRHYDDDNLVARVKAARDGIADALGIDDSRFVAVPEIGEPDPAKFGFVQVTLEPWGRGMT